MRSMMSSRSRSLPSGVRMSAKVLLVTSVRMTSRICGRRASNAAGRLGVDELDLQRHLQVARAGLVGEVRQERVHRLHRADGGAVARRGLAVLGRRRSVPALGAAAALPSACSPVGGLAERQQARKTTRRRPPPASRTTSPRISGSLLPFFFAPSAPAAPATASTLSAAVDISPPPRTRPVRMGPWRAAVRRSNGCAACVRGRDCLRQRRNSASAHETRDGERPRDAPRRSTVHALMSGS